MNGQSFTDKNSRPFIKLALVFFLIAASALSLFAQYKGAPVKKDRLIKALRSKQLQTRDIVTVINTNGVDFTLTEETRQMLVAAGARPEVIKAVAENLRSLPVDDGNFAKKNKIIITPKAAAPDYNDLIDRAMFSYKDQKNPRAAVELLESAVRLNPKKPEAYQMLGFVNLYGLNNAASAEKLMREAVANGGSAVFRVYHDDSGSFNGRCSGSLYISPDTIRFESDDNRHTFETSAVNIDKFRLDRETNKQWKDYPIYKILLKIGKSDMKFRFAPITGKEVESHMVERFVYASKNNITFAGFKN